MLFLFLAGVRELAGRLPGSFETKGTMLPTIGSRKPGTEKANQEGIHAVSVDVSRPRSVRDTFAKVRATLGIPKVVVYNGTLNDGMELCEN
jgi:NAD(P)-dependent dehydrogenase (short-subunit alcohol dehydrogenase family)